MERTEYELINPQKELLLDVTELPKYGKRYANMIGFCMMDRNASHPEYLIRAWNRVVEENDCLRLGTVRRGRTVYQYFSEYERFDIPVESVEDEEAAEKETEAYAEVYVEDIGTRLWTGRVLCWNGGCALLVRLNHLCCDGYSVEMFYDSLEKYYNAYIDGVEPEPIVKRSFKTGIEQDKNYFSGKLYETDKKWWKQQYARQRKSREYCVPTGKRTRFGFSKTIFGTVPENVGRKVFSLGSELNCSPHSFLMTCAAITTYLMTGKRDFMIFSLVHGRTTAVARKTAGCFINTIPMSFIVNGGEKVADMLKRCCSDFFDAMMHMRFPCAEQVPMYIVKSMLNGFNFSNNWLFFNARFYEKPQTRRRVEFINIENDYATSQISCNVYNQEDGGFLVEEKYLKDLFSPEDAQRMLDMYINVVAAVTDNMDATVDELKNKI